MDVRILDSALKHGISEDDILHACNNVIKWRTVERKGNIDGEIEFVLGVLPNGNLCELLTSLSNDEQELIVFHADTPPSKSFQRKLDEKE